MGLNHQHSEQKTLYTGPKEHDIETGVSREVVQNGYSLLCMPIMINDIAVRHAHCPESSPEKQRLWERIVEQLERIALNPLIAKAYAYFEASRNEAHNISLLAQFGKFVISDPQKNLLTASTTTIPAVAAKNASTVSQPKQNPETADLSAIRIAVADNDSACIDLVSVDGVTIPGKPGSDIISKRRCKNVIEDDFKTGTQKLSLGNLTEWIEKMNLLLTEKKFKHDRTQTKATLALAEVKILATNVKHIDIAVVADSKASVIWVDRDNQLHVHTVSNHINQRVDEVTTVLRLIERISGDPDKIFEQLISYYLSKTYEEKFNAGPNTVPILGDKNFSAENIVTHHEEIPYDAKFWKVITYSDGVDLYADFLGVPPWFCALLLEENGMLDWANETEMNITFGMKGTNEQAFLGTHPIGIAALLLHYALLHQDSYPMTKECRGKVDDATRASFGMNNIYFFIFLREYIESLEAEKAKAKVPARQVVTNSLVRWMTNLQRSAQPSLGSMHGMD